MYMKRHDFYYDVLNSFSFFDSVIKFCHYI